MTDRIRWAKDTTDTPGYEDIPEWTGTAGSGDIYLFLIARQTLDGDDYTLSTRLPQMDEKRSYDPDPGRLMAEAESWLEEFAFSLGAIFPEAYTARSENEGGTAVNVLPGLEAGQ